MIVIVLNDIANKSLDQRLITKEYIAMHTNLIILLYTLVIKLFKNSIKLFYAEILTVTLYVGQCSCIIKLHNLHGMPTLKLKHNILLVMYNWLNGFFTVK